MDELRDIKMTTRQDSDDYFLPAYQFRFRSTQKTCKRPVVQDHLHARDIGRLSRHHVHHSQGSEVQLWRNSPNNVDNLPEIQESVRKKQKRCVRRHFTGSNGQKNHLSLQRKNIISPASGQIASNKRRAMGQRDPTLLQPERRNQVGTEIGDAFCTRQRLAATINAWLRQRCHAIDSEENTKYTQLDGTDTCGWQISAIRGYVPILKQMLSH